MRNLHSGYNKINWTRTIGTSNAIIQDNRPIYLNPVNKKIQINFDEELLVIFFSILNYISNHYGFSADINCNFNLIKGKQFETYLNGLGKVRLQQIKYKYFSDKALELWDLCYAFFDTARQVCTNSTQQEYLLVKNFNIVFEAIIDELIGDREIPKGLKEQEDGKRVDHMYTYKGLMTYEEDKPIYYIGDSKYYKRGNQIGKESVYKQFTYARNVIQWNLNLFMNGDAADSEWKGKVPMLRDAVTEGYNIIPNFFISARLNKELSYNEDIEIADKKQIYFSNKQFENRLFDRDTLLICHYDVNFLYVVSLYARNNAIQKDNWKAKVREMFRTEIQRILSEKFEFYAMMPHPDVDAVTYIKEHFQEVLGKIYTPYSNKNIFSLALETDDKYKEDNATLLAELRKYFFVEKCGIGENPEPLIANMSSDTNYTSNAIVPSTIRNVLTGVVRKADKDFSIFFEHQAGMYTMQKIPSINLMDVEYFLPMVSGCIDGYYKVEKLYFATYKENGIDYPCLKLKLGDYINVGTEWVNIYSIMRPGEVISMDDIIQMYESKNKAKSNIISKYI